MVIRLFIGGIILAGALIRAAAGTVSLTPDEITSLRALVASQPTVAREFAGIHRQADAALAATPNPIERVVSEGHLDKDPLKIRTGQSLPDMQKIEALASTWAVTGDGRYADKAREFILAWARVNHSDGDAINETQFEPLITGYDLLRGTFPAADRATADAWLREKANVAWQDHRGLTGNWYSHRLKIVGLIGWTIGDATLANEAVAGYRKHIVGNLKPDGASSDYYLRDALHYHLYDIEPLLSLARAAERNGIRLFDEPSASGSTLHAGVEFVVPFASGTQTHMEFVKTRVPFDLKRAKNGQGEYAPHLWKPASSVRLFSLAAWFHPEYGTLAARLAGHSDEPCFNWVMVLNAVSQHHVGTK